MLALVALCGVAFGSVRLSLADVWAALGGRGDATVVAIVRDLRLPRVALGALVGAGLAMSGAALQGALRNSLAEPYLLGVSGGAAVGAVLAVAVGLSLVLSGAIALAAFAGALAAAGLVLVLARAAGGRADARVLLMAGVVVGAFANASIMVMLSGVSANAVRGALWWMMGSLSDARWSQALGMLVALLVFGGTLLVSARQIDLLALGEEPAAALGVDVDRAGRRVFICAALLAGATVAAAGLIGFVGLVVPHLVRALGARGHRAILAASAIGGATLVIAADVAARGLRPPAELPLGAVTALVGVPFFLVQLRRMAA